MSYRTLIAAAALAQHLGEDNWALVDCRFFLSDTQRGAREYDTSHIPGAVYANLDEDLSSPKTPATGRHPLPDPQQFMQWLGANGVSNTTQVIAYDDASGATAARLWWLLRWLGHDDVAVLDGGWKAWLDGGFPVSSELVTPTPRTFNGEPDTGRYLTTDQLAASLDQILLLDARGRPRFLGKKEPIDPVAGHIHGAINVPFTDNLDESDRMRPQDQIKQRFQAVIGDSTKPVVHMCGSGVSACQNLLAMEHAELSGSKLYVGSWSEWIVDPDRPVATGEE